MFSTVGRPTFLLNEKRADIPRIESRLKVAITVIPNPHLETPTTTSAVCGWMNDSEVCRPVYKLVEKPSEESATAAQEQQKGVRAMPGTGFTRAARTDEAEAVQPSMFGKIFAWINPCPRKEPSQPGQAAAQRAAPACERSERGERPEGGGKRRDRDGRGERRRRRRHRDRNEPRNKPCQAEVAAKPARAREPREPRQPRPPRPPRIAEEKPVLESQVAAAALERQKRSPHAKGHVAAVAACRRSASNANLRRRTRSVAGNGEAVQQSFEQMDSAPVSPAPSNTGRRNISPTRRFVRPSEYIDATIAPRQTVAAVAPVAAAATAQPDPDRDDRSSSAP